MRQLYSFLLLISVLFLAGCAATVPSVNHAVRSEKHVLMTDGIAAFNNNRWPTASDKFNAALALSPRNAKLHFLNAVTYHMQALQKGDGYYAMAEQGYALAIKFAPAEWFYYLYSGLCKIDQKKYHGAKITLANGLFQHAGDADLVYAFLYASYYDLDIENATAALTRLKQLEPGSQRCRYASVMLAAARGDFILAKKNLQQLRPILDNNNLAELLNVRIGEWDSTIAYLHNKTKTNTDTKKKPAPIKMPVAEVPEMIVLDATLVRNEEENFQSMGINLLDGLKIQFGASSSYSDAAAYADSRTTNINEEYYKDDNGEWVFSDASKTVSSAVTRAITVPALSYSLNIFNSGNGHSEVIARPTLVAALNQNSHFFAGMEINAATDANSDSDYSRGTSINLETGVRMTITPDKITSDSVRLQVKLHRSYLTLPSTTKVLYDYMVQQSKTEVSANVLIHYGETLMLSGLLEKETTSNKNGTSLLQDIPVVKYLFSNETKDVFKRSMLIMLTPYRYSSQTGINDAGAGLFKRSFSLPIKRLRNKYKSWYAGTGTNHLQILRQIKAEPAGLPIREGDLLSPEKTENMLKNIDNFRRVAR